MKTEEKYIFMIYVKDSGYILLAKLQQSSLFTQNQMYCVTPMC